MISISNPLHYEDITSTFRGTAMYVIIHKGL